MPTEEKAHLLDLVLTLSDTIDLVSPKLANHHLEVAYIAGELAREYGLPPEQCREILTAGALHDVGALSLTEKLSMLEFEAKNPYRHAEMGYLLLKTFGPFSALAGMVRFHHVPWQGGEGAHFHGERVPLGSHILHLADRVSVLKKKEGHILDQADGIRERIREQSDRMFMPDLVEAFTRLSEKKYFWLTTAAPRIEAPLSRNGAAPELSLDMAEMLDLTKLFAHIIDFRSKFTATHSAGVAAVGKALAALAGFSETDCRKMEMAGHLHDLGKLAVSPEILGKPGKLTQAEFNVIYAHPFLTSRALQRIPGFGTINTWASNHHERVNGRGYPYHRPAADLPLGSKITAVADVFTAVLEQRPYKKDMSVEEGLKIVSDAAGRSELDADIVALLRAHSGKIDSARAHAQSAAAEAYHRFHARGQNGGQKEASLLLH